MKPRKEVVMPHAVMKAERRVIDAAMEHFQNMVADPRLNWSTEAIEQRLHKACAALKSKRKGGK